MRRGKDRIVERDANALLLELVVALHELLQPIVPSLRLGGIHERVVRLLLRSKRPEERAVVNRKSRRDLRVPTVQVRVVGKVVDLVVDQQQVLEHVLVQADELRIKDRFQVVGAFHLHLLCPGSRAGPRSGPGSTSVSVRKMPNALRAPHRNQEYRGTAGRSQARACHPSAAAAEPPHLDRPRGGRSDLCREARSISAAPPGSESRRASGSSAWPLLGEPGQCFGFPTLVRLV
jgi:hypothetical protein